MRTSTLGDAGNLDAPIGSEAWAVAVRIQLQAQLRDKLDAENHLRRWRDIFKSQEGWRALRDKRGRPFASWDAFCRAPKPYGLGLSADDLDAEIERRELRAQNTPGPGRGHKKTVGIDDGFSGKNDRAYILARLERDGHIDLVEQIETGDLSAHAAALQVGYRKQKTPLEQLAHWWQKASGDEQRAFLAWLDAQAKAS